MLAGKYCNSTIPDSLMQFNQVSNHNFKSYKYELEIIEIWENGQNAKRIIGCYKDQLIFLILILDVYER